MSTRTPNCRRHYLSNVATISVLAVFLAACSENASRFADPLFTASTNSSFQPQTAAQSSVTPLPPSEPAQRVVVPQRVDVPQRVSRDNSFRAANVVRHARQNGFRPSPLSSTATQTSPGFGQPLLSAPQSTRGSEIARQSLPPLSASVPSEAVAQELPDRQPLPEATFATPRPAVTPQSRQDSFAGQVNDVNEASPPLLARVPQPARLPRNDAAQTPLSPAVSKSPDAATPAPGEAGGTEWTRRYSPLPTPASAARTTSGPRAYRPPQSPNSAEVDRISTSSIVRSARAPEVIRSSVVSSRVGSVPTTTAIRRERDSDSIVHTNKANTAIASAGRYTVERGDTLSGIARRNRIPLSTLRAANGLANSDTIFAGQVLNMPQKVASAGDAARTTSVDVDPIVTSSTAPARDVSAVSDLPRIKPDGRVRLAPPPARLAEPAPVRAYQKPETNDAQERVEVARAQPTARTEGLIFRWPARGEIISKFGKGTNGTANDGINLDVPAGTPVHAAAAGEVIYASDGLRDYGKLVLIRHQNGYVTAYAHNSDLDVSRGQRVRQGQVIAKSGQTGAVNSPQVHFEIRKGREPVDPLTYLRS